MNKLLSIFSKSRLFKKSPIFKKSPVFDTKKDSPSEVSFTPSLQTDFIFIHQLANCKEQKIALSKGVIITNIDVTDVFEMLKVIRSSNRKEVYLKPIFLSFPTADRALNEQVDGIYSIKQPHFAEHQADSINQRIEMVKKSASQRDVASTIISKAVQFLYTRNKECLTPFKQEESCIGYAYPFVNSFFPIAQNDELVSYLKQGVAESHLEETVINKVNYSKKQIEIGEYKLSFIGGKLAKEGYGEALVEELPKGVVKPVVFQTAINKEISRAKRDNHNSFLVQIGLIKENLAFLPAKAHRELSLECLEIAKRNFNALHTLTFSKDEKIWVLMPELTQQGAVKRVEQVFFYLQKLLHDNLDTQQSLLEVNIYSVLQDLPELPA